MKITKSKLKQLIKEEARKPFRPYQPDQADHDIDTYGTRDNLEPYREMATAALAIPRGIDVHGELDDQLNSIGLAGAEARLGKQAEDLYHELDMGNLINQFDRAVAPKVGALIRLMSVAKKDPQGQAMLDAVYDERPDLRPGFKQSQGVLNTPEKRRGVAEFSESKVKITKSMLKQLIKEELEEANKPKLPKNWRELPRNHPDRVAYRNWYRSQQKNKKKSQSSFAADAAKKAKTLSAKPKASLEQLKQSLEKAKAEPQNDITRRRIERIKRMISKRTQVASMNESLRDINESLKTVND